MIFTIYADEVPVGWSEFPKGDPPTGGLTGPFYPEEGYAKIRPLVLDRRNYDGSLGPLDDEMMERWYAQFYKHVFTIVAEDGGSLHPTGIHFVDFADVLPVDEDPYPYEVSLIGVPYEEYQQYFQALWDAYNTQSGS
jgi:hypothetical protein